MDPLVGTLIGGKYRLEKRLGEGGMGAVYAAVQEGLNRRCAVKVLHSSLSQDGQLVARFKQEAEVAASMGHPNIVQVTDFGFEDGRVFLVMDLLKGQALADAIEAGTMSADRVRFIASQVLSALEAAHARHIVHRDLKPDNIFLTSLSGVRDVVKLLDFGIARMTGEQSQKMTTTGQVLGTPAYMSPEQARGKKVDPRTDLYSLGVVMYEALSGRMPVSGDNYHELMFNIVDETPMPLKELRPDLPQGLLDVVAKAMEKDVEHRYQTAAQMRETLETLGPMSVGAPPPVRVTSEPPLQGPQTVPDAFAKTVTPEAVSAVRVTPLAVPAIRATEPQDSVVAPSTPGAARGGTAPKLAAAVIGLLVLIAGGVWALTPAPNAAPNPAPVAMNAAPTADQLQALVQAQVARELATQTPVVPTPIAPEAPQVATDATMQEQRSGGTEMISAMRSTMSTTSAMTSTRVAAPSEMSEMSEMSASPMNRTNFPSVDPPRGHRGAGPDPWQDWSGNPIVWARCGANNSAKEVYPVLPNTRLTSNSSTSNHVVALEQLHQAVRRWMPGITRCFRGHTINRGQNIDVTIDAEGNVTDVQPFIYCPIPAPVLECLDRVIEGRVPPDQNAPGTFRFGLDVRGA